MPRSRRTILSLVLLAGLVAVPAAAQSVPPIPYLEIVVRPAEPVSLFCLPSGNGAAFADAEVQGGATLDAGLEAILYSDTPGWGDPIANYPAEDLWLDDVQGTLADCIAGTIADRNTDAEGRTFWRQPLRAGGRVDPDAGNRVIVLVNGDAIMGPPDLQLRINSADINGDGLVNLTDVGMFASDLLGGYRYRSDFHWDGVINLSDAGLLAFALGDACP